MLGNAIVQGLTAAMLLVSGATAYPSSEVSEQVHQVKRTTFRDDFINFNKDVWACEYTCPTIEGEKARFRVHSGVSANKENSWSKARYKPKRFTSGRFSTSYSLTARPRNQPVWWGVALYDDTYGSEEGQINEINFGYTTKYSYSDSQLLFEVYKRGHVEPYSVKVDLGVNLYSEEYHTGELEWDSNHVAFYFDGKKVAELTDKNLVPTDPMDFLIGARLVDDTSGTLTTGFTESHDWVEIQY